MELFKAALAKAWRPFFLHTAIVLTSAWLASYLPAHVPAGFVNPCLAQPSPFAASFLKWDAHWYTYIAAQGYDAKSVVFFPILVLLIRLVAGLGLDYVAAGLLVCNVFAFLSFVALSAAFRYDFPPPVTERALYVYAVMPTSIFLNSIYTESLFITFALTCVLLARQGKWWQAGACAALAALTRNLGVFLFFGLAYEYWVRHRSNRQIPRSVLALLLAPCVVLGFMAYTAVFFGDPLAFVHSQQAWGRSFGWPWDNFVRNLEYMKLLFPNTQTGIALDSFLVLSGFAGLAAATLSPRYGIPVSYLLVGWLWFLVPLFSTSPFLPLYSMSRFLLVVFPLYPVFTRMPKVVFGCFLAVNALLLSLCTILFVNWYWIG
jgi:Gpi18-like mannosyltransferase